MGGIEEMGEGGQKVKKKKVAIQIRGKKTTIHGVTMDIYKKPLLFCKKICKYPPPK